MHLTGRQSQLKGWDLTLPMDKSRGIAELLGQTE